MTGILALQGILGSSARPDRRLAGATRHLVDLVADSAEHAGYTAACIPGDPLAQPEPSDEYD